MASTETKKTTTASKPKGVKKTAAKKPVAKKATAKKPAAKRTTKKVAVNSRDIPEGLRSSVSNANKNLDNSIVTNKGKKKKRRKKGGNAEKVFWIIVLISLIAVGVFGALFVLEDYNNDSSTPVQLNTPQITDENLEIVQNIGADIEYIK